MAWTTPRTWVAGELVTASLMNTYIRDDFAYLKDSPTFDGNVTVAGTLTVAGRAVGPSRNLCQGRLTLTSSTPVTTADVTAATTLYWSPYIDNQVALYDGSSWVLFDQAQLSIAVPATTDTMYDVFINYNAGTPALALTAWTNDTTRATALTTQDGVFVKTGSTGQRYVGSFRTTGSSGQTEDSNAKRYVWNYYHRVPRYLAVLEATNSWTYTTAAYRQANNSTANQVDVVVGVAEVLLDLSVTGVVANDTGGIAVNVAIGEDSVVAMTSGTIGMRGYLPDANAIQAVGATLKKYPAIGRHYYAWLEYSTATGTTTWYGDNNAPTVFQAGIAGWLLG